MEEDKSVILFGYTTKTIQKQQSNKLITKKDAINTYKKISTPRPPTLEEILKIDMNEIINNEQIKRNTEANKQSPDLNKFTKVSYENPKINAFTQGGFLNG